MGVMRSCILLFIHLVLSRAWTSTRPSIGLSSLALPENLRSVLFLAAEDEKSLSDDSLDIEFESEDAKKEAVGNLVADDEWLGISMELSEVVRLAVVEDLKKNARAFLGKDEYKVGDFSKELDNKVKEEVAKFRGKDECKLFDERPCLHLSRSFPELTDLSQIGEAISHHSIRLYVDELGDFVMAMDEASKKMTEELTGKPYEAGDLSIELDKRIKAAVANFAGKEDYEPGDLTKTVTARVVDRVEGFTGKPYEFGDISRKVEEHRQKWVQQFLGDEAAANYQFGDITRKALANFAGKDEYQFGDVTKKIFGDLFGKRKRGGERN